MATLYLLRHAHASPDLPGEGDHDRPLDGRGQTEARELGAVLQREEVRVEAVLCSSARRALETWEGLTSVWSTPVSATVSEALYLASAAELLSALSELPAGVGSVLLLAHNPGLHELAVSLAGEGAPEAYAKLRSSYPTAALCQLEFDGPWQAWRVGRASLVRFDPLRGEW